MERIVARIWPNWPSRSLSGVAAIRMSRYWPTVTSSVISVKRRIVAAACEPSGALAMARVAATRLRSPASTAPASPKRVASPKSSRAACCVAKVTCAVGRPRLVAEPSSTSSWTSAAA